MWLKGQKFNIFISFIISLAIGGIFLLMVIMSNKVTEDDFMYLDIGNSRIYTYKYGLAIFEKGTQNFYNISPFDMYIEDTSSPFRKYFKKDKTMIGILDWTDNLLAVEYNTNKLTRQINRFESYFNLGKPKATFTKDNAIVEIIATKKSEDIVTFSLNIPATKTKNTVEMSFTLNDDDILIDDKNRVYYKGESSDFHYFSSFYNLSGFEEFSSESLSYSLETKYLLVTNPSMAGYYEIFPENGIVEINSAAKRINFTVDSSNPKFDLKIGSYLSERLSQTNGNY